MGKLREKKTTKFCIFAIQRSGSTWLHELLDSHPEVKVLRGEIFLDRKQENIWVDPNLVPFYEFKNANSGMRPWLTFQYLNSLDSYPGEHHAIGFKLMYNQVARKPEILAKLVSDRFKIIHIIRQNYLDATLSGINIREKGISHTTNKVNIGSTYVDTSFLLRNILKREFQVKLANILLAVLPNIVETITYEELCENRDLVLQDLANFLGVAISDINFKSDLQKINRGSYRDKIENYEEVKQVLSGTRFEILLDEKV